MNFKAMSWHVSSRSSDRVSTAKSDKANGVPTSRTDFSIASILSKQTKSNDCKLKTNPAHQQLTSNNDTEIALTTEKPKVADKTTPRKRKLSRNPRVPFSATQLAVLETHFLKHRYVSGSQVVHLASNLRLSEDKIKVWFQNRRARERREMKKRSASSNGGFNATSRMFVTAQYLPRFSANPISYFAPSSTSAFHPITYPSTFYSQST